MDAILIVLVLVGIAIFFLGPETIQRAWGVLSAIGAVWLLLRYLSPQRVALRPFRKLSFDHALANRGRSATAYVNGRVLPLQLPKKIIEKSVFFRLPENIRPATPEQVGTVVWIDKQEERIGRRTDGSAMIRIRWNVKLVDLATLLVTAENNFSWDPPTFFITDYLGNVEAYGGSAEFNLDVQLVAYLKTLLVDESRDEAATAATTVPTADSSSAPTTPTPPRVLTQDEKHVVRELNRGVAYGSMDEKKYIITLVHGTFARNASWAQSNSYFTRELTQHLSREAEFTTFNWSGKNSHYARRSAGEALARQLECQLAKWPSRKHFVIAHSHGGNVAMYAQSDPKVTGRLCGIVTMGTPFLKCEPRRIDTLMEAVSTMLVSALAVLMWVPIALFGSSIVLDATSWFVVVIILIALLSSVSSWRNKTIYLLDNNSRLERLRAYLLGWAQKLQANTSARIDFKIDHSSPLLTVVVADDEARLWLGFIHFTCNLLPAVLKRVEILIAPLAVMSCLVILNLVFSGANQAITPDAPVNSFFRLTDLLIAVIGAVCLPVCLLFGVLQLLSIMFNRVVRAHRLGFGGESVWDNWLSDILITEAPENVVSESVTTISEEVGLRHSSFYRTGSSIEIIARWIDRTASEAAAG